MDPNTVVLEISSDEDVDWNDHNGRGIADGGDDHDWLANLLDEVRKGDDSDDVVVVGEVSPSNKSKLKSSLVDYDDDCVVLDHDPDKPQARNDNPSKGDDDSDDIVIVSEKGQVACRDYPHSRHLCIKFPFSTTPNQNHCEQCYCYVCDSLAPCVYWGNGNATTDHCHATDKDQSWILERKNAKNGNKNIQNFPKINNATISNQPPPGHHIPPPQGMVQPHNQVRRPGPIYVQHPSANFRPLNNINQYPTPVFPSRSKLHPNLVSQFVRATGPQKVQNHTQRPVFKRTGSGAIANTTNRHAYRGNFGNPNPQQQNYQNSGSFQHKSVNTSVSYPSQSQNLTCSTVNQLLPRQPQIFTNPNIQSQVNSNPFPGNPNPLYRLNLGRTSSQPEMTSRQPSQPNIVVPSQTRVNSPLIPVTGHTQNLPEGQNPTTIEAGLKDYELTWPPSQESVTLGLTSESSLAGGLAEPRYDWLFDDPPVDPGFIEFPDPYDFSCDSSFIDTGPIFEF